MCSSSSSSSSSIKRLFRNNGDVLKVLNSSMVGYILPLAIAVYKYKLKEKIIKGKRWEVALSIHALVALS